MSAYIKATNDTYHETEETNGEAGKQKLQQRHYFFDAIDVSLMCCSGSVDLKPTPLLSERLIEKGYIVEPRCRSR
ncbi:hypothetical protein GCM10028809_04330 [Spirosoma gilvum]